MKRKLAFGLIAVALLVVASVILPSSLANRGERGRSGDSKAFSNSTNMPFAPVIVASPPAVITAESISPANNAVDPEETVTVNLTLANTGPDPTTNLVATLQPTGGVAGPSAPQNYGFIAASGGAQTRPFKFTGQGACGNNITLTLALQDGATNLGTVTFTMTLGAGSSSTTTFTNSTAIVIPASGTGTATGAPATPYPSNITVAGITAPVIKVAVTLKNISHTFPDDVDILLVGPTGRKFIAISDAGDTNDWLTANITLDDSAASSLLDSGNNPTGSYKPGNFFTVQDPFPAPAPAGAYLTPAPGGTDTFATAFNGQNPNGTWNLYVVDDAGQDTGTFAGGWDLAITSSSSVCNTQSCTITAPTSMTIPPGTCGTNVTYSPAVSFTGACGVLVGPNPPTTSFFGIGTTTVFVRGTRADASFTDASFPVTVQESETQATGLGANVTNNYCNTTVNYTAVTGAGSTTVVDAPQQTLPPPYIHCNGCPELQITTTATFTAPVITCVTMPASTDSNTFSRLRILHGEPGLVNRTITSNFTTKQICARTATVSPFVVVLDPNAPTAAPANISGRITTPEGSPVGGAVMHLSGPLSKTTITDSDGNYHFNDLDTGDFYTVTPSLANYHFSPANRSFSLVANQTDAAFTANADASQSANAIDSAEYFVRQQYLDFLGREPDQEGFEYWSGQINQCGADAACLSQKRIDVSAAFFMSGEFQATGSYVYDMYAGLLGRTPGYGEFTPDRAQVVGGSGLDAAKAAFAQNFVQRGEFISRYPAGLSREQFVDAVLQTMQQRSGADLSSLRAGLLADYDNGGRGLVARHAAESGLFVSAEYNRAFVLMEYFGYLRRGEDTSGYDFWLSILNQGSGNNYRGMVCSFLTSAEYQQRFSSVVTHGNGECQQQ